MRAWRPLLMLAAAFGGCGQSCSCSCDGEKVPAAPVATSAPATAKPAEATPAAAPGVAQANAPALAAGGAGQGGDLGSNEATLKRWLAGASGDKSRLDEVKKRLGGAKAGAAAATPATLGAVFPARLAGFVSHKPADTGTLKVGTTPLPVASRSYQGPKSADGPSEIYVKLTDVSAAPQLRAPVIAALSETSDMGGYYTRGGFVRGYPAVLTYAAQHRAGKAAVLLGDHYLLEARIEPVTSPEDIATVLGQLDWSRLVARDAK